MNQATLTPDQFHELKKDLISSLESRYKIVPLNSLMHPKYYLTQPVHIILERDRDTIVASLNEIEAFASAPTEYEAVENLREDIVMLYEDLSSDRESLGILPLKWLHYLEGIIQCR